MQDVHRCLDGRRLLITHGDQYDLVVRHSRLLSKIGSSAYEMLLRLNGAYNRYRRWRQAVLVVGPVHEVKGQESVHVHFKF